MADMTTSPAPISAADREVDPDDLGDALEAAGMSIGVPRPQMLALAARVVELEAALAAAREERDSFQRVGIASEARATALLEALQSAVKVIRSGVPQDAFGRGENNRWEKDIFLDEFNAAINAGASNDRK